MNDATDPVLESRARASMWVSLGLRSGGGLFALAMLLFFAGFGIGFTRPLTSAITFCLIVGSAILAPSIVFSHAIKAADRADRDGTW